MPPRRHGTSTQGCSDHRCHPDAAGGRSRRILSVMAWYHLAFFAISMAMFGLTAGAVWLYLRRDRFTDKTLSYESVVLQHRVCHRRRRELNRTNDVGACVASFHDLSRGVDAIGAVPCRSIFLLRRSGQSGADTLAVSDRTGVWSGLAWRLVGVPGCPISPEPHRRTLRGLMDKQRSPQSERCSSRSGIGTAPTPRPLLIERSSIEAQFFWFSPGVRCSTV